MCLINVTIVGADTQGSMLAYRSALYGKRVILFDLDSEQIENAKKKINQWLENKVLKKQLTEIKKLEIIKHLKYELTLKEALLESDIVIENVPEKIALKREVWHQIDALAPLRAILATNSSSFKSSTLNRQIRRKTKTLSLSFSNPVLDDFVELMWNEDTSKLTKEEVLMFLDELDYIPLITKREIKGFSMNRLWHVMNKECLLLWANDYVCPIEFDKAFIKKWGTTYGPFELMDKAGLDLVYDMEMSYFNETENLADHPPRRLKEMIEKAHLGEKSGIGFYDYHKLL
jgi:3-hydroxybutyryl-CoA dehydrogenase